MRSHPNHVSAALVLIVMMFTASVRADPQSEARALKEESLKILKATADRDATPDEMAKCIFNLEKAANMLEAAHDSDSNLALEINSELYWSRKRSTLAIDAALDKMRGASGVAKPAVPAKTAPAKADPNAPAEMQPGMEEARKAFQEAEKFASAHGDDDYVVSLHWFQMASLHSGTDYSLKALTLAREAQSRFKSKNPSAVKEEIPDTAEMKPVIEAEPLVKASHFDKAIPLYLASLKIKESTIAHRKLGQAYYARAQQVKEEVVKKCEKTYAAWTAARNNAYRNIPTLGGGNRRVFNPNDPAFQAATREFKAAYKEGDAAFELFDKAQTEFKAVLHSVHGGKDLIAAGLIGICISQRPDIMNRSNAKGHLAVFLKDYSPANDDERTIYEYCKTELERLSK